MKKQITTEYLELLATAYHYRVIMLLLTGSYTQSQLAEKLGIKRQSQLDGNLNLINIPIEKRANEE